MLISRYAVFLSIMLITAGSVVAAAGGAEGPPSPLDGPAPPPPWARHEQERPLPGARIEAELAYIKTALKLTDRQMPAWQPVADTLRARALRMDAEIGARMAAHDRPSKGEGGAIDVMADLEEQQRALSTEADELAKLLAVVKPFYAVLTAEQRQDADEVLPLGPPRMWPQMPGLPMPCPPPFIDPLD